MDQNYFFGKSILWLSGTFGVSEVNFGKTAKKWRPYWILGHKMAQKQNFQNRYIKSVEHHTENLQMKFQVPSNVYKLSKCSVFTGKL